MTGAVVKNQSGLEPRVRELEKDVAVAQNDISGIKEDMKPLPKAISSLEKAVSSLKTYVAVSWALTLLLMAAIITGSVAVWFSGGVP